MKRILEDSILFYPTQTDTHPHLSAAILLKAAFNNVSRTNKTHPNIRGKRNEKREGGKKERQKRLQAFPEAVSQLNVL